MLSKKDQTKSNRLKPKKVSTFGEKKSPIKKKAYVAKVGLNPNKPVRFQKEKLQQRVYNILNLGCCQVCEESYDLDYPHHVEQGSKKDDRTMINICIGCHDLIHRVGYSAVKKDRSECLVIALSNHDLLENKNV